MNGGRGGFLTASWAELWANCPGFARLNTAADVNLPRPPEATEGIDIHASVKRLAETGEQDQYSKEFGIPFLRLLSGNWSIETEVPCNWLGCGTIRIDGLCLSDKITVWELKTGFYPVPAEHNLQLLIYGLTLRTWHPTLPLELAVFQPRDYSEPVKRWTVPNPENWARFIFDRYQLAKQGETLVSGDHCHLCPARFDCPALRIAGGLAIDQTQLYHRTVPSPQEIGAEISALRTAQLRIKSRLAALESLAAYRINRGVPIPGYELQPGTSNRQWVNTDTAVYIMQAAGVDPFEHKLISPAKAETKGVNRALIAELTKRSETSPTLKPVTKPKGI